MRAGNGFKRCAIVDIVPTGSYHATLKRIGLNRVSFKGFPFRTFENIPPNYRRLKMGGGTCRRSHGQNHVPPPPLSPGRGYPKKAASFAQYFCWPAAVSALLLSLAFGGICAIIKFGLRRFAGGLRPPDPPDAFTEPRLKKINKFKKIKKSMKKLAPLVFSWIF